MLKIWDILWLKQSSQVAFGAYILFESQQELKMPLI